MIIGNTYTIEPKKLPDKPFIEAIQEICTTDPKPIFCEVPDELKLKSVSSSGTAQTYTYTSSLLSTASGFGTSTTTT